MSRTSDRTRARHGAALAAVLVAGGLSACDVALDAGRTLRGRAGATTSPGVAGQTPGPAASGEASPGVTPSPTIRPTQQVFTGAPTPTPGSSGGEDVNGLTTAGGSASVDVVTAVPPALALNAPSADGANPAGYPATASLTAEARLTDGNLDDAGVTWSVADDSRLGITTGGVVSVKAGAATGSTTVTATAVRTPSVKKQVIVTITADGKLQLAIMPEVPADRASKFTTSLTVTKGLAQIAGVSAASDDVAVRLPAGSGYQVLVVRHEATDSLDVPIGPSGRAIRTAATASLPAIPVNAIATASITLEASASSGLF